VTTMPDKQRKRIFFALWPDNSVRESISGVLQKSIYSDALGQAHSSQNLHLTLHFLGNLDSAQISCALQQAGKVKADKFELILNGFGCFEKAKILWLGPKQVPLQLTELYKNLAESLGVCNVSLESRRFQPHVTLMRKFNDFKASDIAQAVHWRVGKFALVESVSTANGVAYRPLQFFPLDDHG